MVKLMGDAWLWHRRLGHQNFQILKLVSQKNMVQRLPKIENMKYGMMCTWKASSTTISK